MAGNVPSRRGFDETLRAISKEIEATRVRNDNEDEWIYFDYNDAVFVQNYNVETNCLKVKVKNNNKRAQNIHIDMTADLMTHRLSIKGGPKTNVR